MMLLWPEALSICRLNSAGNLIRPITNGDGLVYTTSEWHMDRGTSFVGIAVEFG